MINILHISDIHLGTKKDPRIYQVQLEFDLLSVLNIRKLDYLVISGDIGTYSAPDEYIAAVDLIDGIVRRFGIEQDHIIIVPGNHDVNWYISEQAYNFIPKRAMPDPLPYGKHIPAGDHGVLICDDTLYKRRFENFSNYFYKPVTGKNYPDDYANQGNLYISESYRILFLGLNSSWEIDHHFTNRSGIHTGALYNALDRLDDLYSDWLKIAVWHHPVTGPEAMQNVDFLELLAVHGFRLFMHGHIHEARQGFYTYDPGRNMHIIGAGTFGSPAVQVPGIPLQYNLIKYNPHDATVTVETRKKEKPEGAWSADARWGDKNNPTPRYKLYLKETSEKTDKRLHQVQVGDTINIKSYGDVVFAKDRGLMNIARSSAKKVFISCSREDVKIAKKLYSDLRKEGIEPWMAKMDILPGQNWHIATYNAIKDCNFFITLLSSNSIKSPGYHKKELKIALKVLDGLPISELFIIPVRIDDCRINEPLLSDLHPADLFPSYEDGFDRILRAITSERRIHPRLKSFWIFLSTIGFKKGTIFESGDFIALPNNMFWKNRFRKGLYISFWNDDSSPDKKAVDNIYKKSKEHTNHAVLYTNRQPTLDGSMAMASLRLHNTHPFTLIPVTDALINDALVSHNESSKFADYTDKYLGRGYNPYDVRDPVFDGISFFGREVILDELTNELTLGKRIGLFGIHKIGKSSVLKFLQKRLEFPAAYCYLRSGMILDEIYKSILTSWNDEVRIKYPNIVWEMNPDAFEKSFRNLMNHLTDAAPVPYLAVFLDEIESIIPNREGDNKALERYLHLMETLRGLQQETGCLSLLVAGVHPTLARVNYFWGNQKNPMHQVIKQKFLPPLATDDCNMMIRSLGQHVGIDFDNETSDYIIRKSGAHPYIARQLCSTAYRIYKKPGVIPMDIVREAAEEFVYNPSKNDYFNDNALWGELGKADIWGAEVSKTNHRILLDLASTPHGLTKTELFHDVDRLTFKQAFFGLTERSIISIIPETDLYHITFGLFQDWISVHKLDHKESTWQIPIISEIPSHIRNSSDARSA
ncbi:TIR domain-containing protein [Desulfobacterales bacterium HSG2]|nr:TIR domain-containing protein [Desulfobacterales bacterium HSG2]